VQKIKKYFQKFQKMALNQGKIKNKLMEKHRECHYSKIHMCQKMKLDIFSILLQFITFGNS
jgi:hypothetical protein